MKARRSAGIRILSVMLLALLMAAPVLPLAGATGIHDSPGPRAVTDTASVLIVPAGETYDLWGCHTYTNGVWIDGTLNVKSYDGIDASTGTLTLKAGTIIINSTGKVVADGRGYGGGGGGSSDATSVAGGKGGMGGIGGNGAAATEGGVLSANGGGGGGGSNGGKGGAGSASGSDGTAAGGGAGGSTASKKGGLGGTGFGSGGGGGAGTNSVSLPIGGGGGGGGSGGASSPSASGGNGGGDFGGIAGPSTSGSSGTAQNGKDGGYQASSSNGDNSTDISVVRGGGGGGGGASTAYGGGAGGGGAGGGAITLISDGELTIAGAVSTSGSDGGKGGVAGGKIVPDDRLPGPGPVPVTNTGGSGGSGAGGGIALVGDIVRISGTVNALGKLQGVASSINGGTIKIFPNELKINGTLAAGKNWTNYRPSMKGLASPANNSFFSVPPEMSWAAAVDPEQDSTSYQLQLDTDVGFSSPVLDKLGLDTTKFTPITALPESAYFWRVRAWDAIGPGRWSPPSNFAVDATPPESSVKPLPSYTLTPDFQVAWNGTDNCAGISDYTIFFSDTEGDYRVWKGPTQDTSGQFNGVDGTTFRFYSVAQDKASNTEPDPGQPDSWTTVDASPPSSSISPLAPYQPREDFTVNWSGKDNTSGISSYTVSVSEDGGSFSVWQDKVLTTSAVYTGQDGHEYRFHVVARDNAGFSEPEPASDSPRIVTTRVDLNAPTTVMSLVGPAFGKDPEFISPTTKVELQAQDSYSGMGITQYTIDGGAVQKYQSPFKVECPGHHNLTFWSQDRAQNREADQKAWLCVDGEPPVTVLSIEGPGCDRAGRMYITPLSRIGLSATDSGSGVARTEYSLDGAAFLEYTRPLSVEKSGNHTIKFRSIDNLGTKEADRARIMEVDTTPPRTTAVDTLDSEAHAITVALRSEDYQSGVAGTSYRILEGKDVAQDWTNGTTAVIAAPEDHGGDGKYKVEYFAVDNLGNKEDVRSLDITIDTLLEIAIAQPEKVTVGRDRYTFTGTAEKGATVTINGDAVQLASDGKFTMELPLHEGVNEIELKATDSAGNTKTTTYFVTYKVAESGNGLMLPMIAVGVLVVISVVVVLLLLRRKGGDVKPAPPRAGKSPKKTVRKTGKPVKR